MKIGYARVSTIDQNLDHQLDALREAGCEQIYSDKISGAKKHRPEFDKMLGQLRKGDVVIVYKLDRLGRSLKNLVETVAEFQAEGIEFQSLKDNIDTSTPQGRLFFHLFASLAEFERDLIRERTQAGLASARARGRLGGRPKGLSEEAENKAIACEGLYREAKLSANDIARRLNISKATLYKYLRHRGVEISPVNSVKSVKATSRA